MRAIAAYAVRAWQWTQVQWTVRRQEGLIQAAKMALAAVLAWMLARQIHEPQSFIAPYVAVFLISQTIYRSVMDAARQLTAIVMGVVLSFAVITLFPQQVLALAVAVFVGMVLGRSPWLRSSGVWVGVVALLMVTSQTADNPVFLLYRVFESCIGAVIGAAVNLLVLPPVHLRQAEQVVTGVSTEITQLLKTMTEGVRQNKPDWETSSWLQQARDLDRTVYRAREAVGWGYESTRFNPEWRSRSDRKHLNPAASWSAIDTLGEVTRQVQRMAEALASANQAGGSMWPTDGGFNLRFARLLERVAVGVERYQSLDDDHREARVEVSEGLDDTERMMNELSEPDEERSGWTAQGALLLAAERGLRALQADMPTTAE